MLDSAASQSPARPAAQARPLLSAALHYAALAGAMLIAFFLHFFRLEQEGFANQYYAAAVKSMLQSWHNFFFVAFDPGGFVSVDKPPLGLWMQAISAHLFGFDGWSLMLPQALAGVLSVALLYYLVRRVFGPTAGLLAALMLALTPISVAANRNNTMDSQLVLTSLLAAWAISLAAEKGKLRWLLVCAVFVGLGFNIKMLQAFLVLPAFYLLYLIAPPLPWWKRLLHLAAATVVLAAVSLSWAVAVDLTPADQRPYVGSSRDNTVMELILGHNGATRLGQVGQWLGLQSGRAARPGGPAGQPGPDDQPNQPPPGGQQNQPPPGPPPGQQPPLGGQPGQRPPNPPPNQAPSPNSQPRLGPQPQGGNQPPGPGADGPPGRGLNSETGEPGLFRLFNQQLAGQASWLLPLAGIGLAAAAWQTRLRWPLARRHQALLLWGAWLIPQLIFFSFAGLFHRYYLEMLSPAIAALAGAGLVALWQDYGRGGWRAWLLPAALLITAAVEAFILAAYPDWSAWLSPIVIALTLGAAGGLVLIRLARRPATGLLPALLAGVGALALLIAPAAWSATPLLAGGDSGLPYASPELLTGRRGARNLNTENPLVDFLVASAHNETYLAATLNANTAAPIILATGEPVMAMGGFSGSDSILAADELAALVSAGEVRFFIIPQSGGQAGPNARRNQQADLTAWITANCAAVPAAQWQTGSPGGPGSPPAGPGGPQQLFDCAAAGG